MCWPFIMTDEDILHCINQENGREYKAVVLLKVLVSEVLKEMHDKLGHYGLDKTYSIIKRNYFWPKMIKGIQKNV